MTEPKCETCRFAKVIHAKGQEYRSYIGMGKTETRTHQQALVSCRRHAPVMSQRTDGYDGWPSISGEEWCGEYQPKEQSNEIF